MKLKNLFVFIPAFLSCLICGAARAQLEIKPRLLVKFMRPASGETNFSVFVKKQYDTVYAPCAGITVALSGPQNYSAELKTDAEGKVDVSVMDIVSSIKDLPKEITLTASASIEGLSSQDAISFTLGETQQYYKETAEYLISKGNEAAKAGNFTAAANAYKNALSFNPKSARAAYNLALAYEKAGMPYLAVERFSEYLLSHASDRKDRFEVKTKIIQLARNKNIKLPPPPALKALMEEGLLKFEAGKYFEAIERYETAQSIAPLLCEPYFAEGTVFEYLGDHKNPLFYASAIQNYELFLQTADGGDSRIKQIKGQIETMKRIDAGLSQSKTVFK